MIGTSEALLLLLLIFFLVLLFVYYYYYHLFVFFFLFFLSSNLKQHLYIAYTWRDLQLFIQIPLLLFIYLFIFERL